MPITWTCDPPEFAAYVNRATATARGDFVLVEMDMRCKRVLIFALERKRWDEGLAEEVSDGALEITFCTNDPEADIIYPRRLGDYTGARPVVTIHHGRADLAVEAECTGRYTVRVVLLRKELAGSPIEPGDEQTAAAHKHGAEHGWTAQEKT